ncbi:MAG: hypothetical protein J5I28_04015 [Acidimicrobiales bacterium]|jgi:hypothetical protein|nr:hypothetical protein [Acidimicrobiales bacterium]HLV89900.1 hypothetical protein [Acidimicrobiia bacterium]
MPITREDIEAKAMEIIDAVDETREAAKDKAVLGLVVAAGLVALAFIIGRKRGSQGKTLVEVYRI